MGVVYVKDIIKLLVLIPVIVWLSLHIVDSPDRVLVSIQDTVSYICGAYLVILSLTIFSVGFIILMKIFIESDTLGKIGESLILFSFSILLVLLAGVLTSVISFETAVGRASVIFLLGLVGCALVSFGSDKQPSQFEYSKQLILQILRRS